MSKYTDLEQWQEDTFTYMEPSDEERYLVRLQLRMTQLESDIRYSRQKIEILEYAVEAVDEAPRFRGWLYEHGHQEGRRSLMELLGDAKAEAHMLDARLRDTERQYEAAERQCNAKR